MYSHRALAPQSLFAGVSSARAEALENRPSCRKLVQEPMVPLSVLRARSDICIYLHRIPSVLIRGFRV